MGSSDDGKSSSPGSQDGTHVLDYLANFIETSLDAIVATDSLRRIVFWNLAAERTFGWKAIEALGRSVTELFWPTSIDQDQEEQRESQLRLQRGEVVKGEEVIRCKDGSPLWIAYSIRTVVDNGSPNGVAGYVAVYRDISERKRAEQQLLITLESIKDGFFACDVDWRFVYVNAQAERILGIKREEVLGMSYWGLFPLTLGTNLELEYRRAAAGEVRDFENFYQPWGRWFHNRCFPREGGGMSVYLEDITERKRTEEQLERGNQKLNQILDSIQDDFYMLDRDWNFVYANRQFTSRIGKEPMDFIGNIIWEMFPKHIGGVLYKNFHETMEKREVRRFEIPGRYTNAWYRITAFPSEEGITVLGTDITDRKRAEEQLRYQATLLKNVNDAIVASDAQFCITAWNSGAEALYGWTAEEVIGRNGVEMIRTEWPEKDGDEMRRTIAETGHWRGEATQARKDGSRFPVEVSSMILYDDQGQIKGYVSVNRDITERKQAEQALRESEARYRHLVKHAPAGIYEIDVKSMRFIEVNDIMCEILGYTREELLSMLPEELLKDEGKERFKKRMIQTLAGENVSEQIEYKIMARDGREIWAVLNTTVNYEEGKARSVSVIAHDITERKRMEREIESLAKFPQENPNPVLRIDRDGAIVFANVASDNLLRLWNRAVGEHLPETEYKLILQTLESHTAVEREIDCAGRIYSLIFTPNADSGYVNVYGRDITERKRAEEALRNAMQELHAHLDNSPLAVIAFDPEYHITEWSAGAERMFGWRADEVLNKRIVDLRWVHEEDAQRVSNLSADMLVGRELRNVHTNRNYRNDGSVIECEWYNSALLDANGKLISVRSQVLDVTERKRAEESLRAKTEEIDTLLQVSPIAFLVAYDPECRRITANPAGYRLVKLPQDLNLNISKSAPVEGQPSYRVFRDGVELASQDLPMQKAARLGIDVVEESLELRFEDGSSKYIYCYARPLIGEDSRPRGAIAAMLDITERKQAEEKIRSSEERFRNLANTVPSIVWTAEPDGTIIYTNEYWHKYTGSSTEETGISWIEFLHPDDLERSVSAWANAVRTGTDYFVERRIRRYDGQYRWFQARALPVRDELGNIVAWYGVSTDIHDRIEALHALQDSQQQLQFLNESLEQKVNEQTAELRRLTASLTKAEQRERSRIAHILHDDLQQRLYAVKLRLASLMNVRTVAEAVEKEVAELDKQLAEILLLTRHLTIEMSPPVLRDEGLRQAIEWLAFQMDEKVGMRVEVQAEESFAIADEAVQVLLFNCVRELLFNIVKHAGVNRAAVSLQRSGDHLRIEVWDDGKGFDVAALFGNNRNSLDDEEEKATFGLPTLRHQLGLLGGQMDIQSEPDAGTRITITIPYS